MNDELNDLKTLLMIDKDDNNYDEIITLIIKLTKQALLFKLGLTSNDKVPDELDYISKEVSIRRYNRLKNEGFKTFSQSDENITFNSNDFIDFEKDIADWKYQNDKDNSTLGTLFVIDAYGVDNNDI